MASAGIVEAIRGFRFRYADEDELQEGLAAALASAGFAPRREVRLNARDRIDLLIGRVGVEVKVASPAETVRRQVTRYAQSDALDELVVVTSRVRHLRLPAEIDGKPLTVVTLTGAGL